MLILSVSHDNGQLGIVNHVVSVSNLINENMKFCLNKEHNRENVNQRLTIAGTWRDCDDPSELETDDWTTNKPELVKNQEQENPLPGSESGMDYEKGAWTYKVYCFRNTWPEAPDIQQLEETLRSGDDSKRNSLCLKIDGKYFLIEEDYDEHEDDPTIVVQFRSSTPGGGYVGEMNVDESDDDYAEYINDCHTAGLRFWTDHLQSKELYNVRDDDEFEGDLETVLGDLEFVKENWVPSY